jgi:Sulfatase-modifying factor enzyme 1
MSLLLLAASVRAAPDHPKVREVRSLTFLAKRYDRLWSWVEQRIETAKADVRAPGDVQALGKIHYDHLLQWGASQESGGGDGAVDRAIETYARALGVGLPAAAGGKARERVVALRLGEAERMLGAGGELAPASAHIQAVLALAGLDDADGDRARNLGFRIDSHEADRLLKEGDLTRGYEVLAAVIERYGSMDLSALDAARERLASLGRDTDLLVIRTFDASAAVAKTNPLAIGKPLPLGLRATLHLCKDLTAADEPAASCDLGVGKETRMRVLVVDGRRFSLRIPFAEGGRPPLRVPVNLTKGGATVTLPDRVPARMAYVPDGQGFFIGLYEVTREEMNAWRKATGKRARRVTGAGFPAREVAMADVDGFLEFAGVTLPSIAEWGLAALGNDGRDVPWGRGNAKTRANIYSDSGMLESVQSRAGDVSPYGLHHVLGNVWELVDGGYALGGSTDTPYPLRLSYNLEDGRLVDWTPDLLRDARPLKPAVPNLGPEQRLKWKEVLFDKENPGASSVNQEGIGFRVVLRVGR